MHRILIYSQVGSMGGSTRLLLNLGRHLAKSALVFVSLPPESSGIDSTIREAFPDLNFIGQTTASINEMDVDVALLHLPFSVPEGVKTLQANRKLAVSMEIISRHPPTIDDASLQHFDRLLYLHEEQVSHLSYKNRSLKCKLVPLINNIDFNTTFEKTRCVGTIGGPNKVTLSQLIKVAARLPIGYRLLSWSNRAYRVADLSGKKALKYKWLTRRKKLQLLPPEVDVEHIMSNIDCLLHLPKHGNGTSTVVSDALACGKMVILSDTEANRQAYNGLEGVYFNTDDKHRYASILSSYNIATWHRIKTLYRKAFPRENALNQWTREIIGDCL